MKRSLTLLLALTLIPAWTFAGQGKTAAGIPTFVTSDNFGYLHATQGRAARAADLEQIGLSAVSFAQGVVATDFQAAGGEEFVVKKVWIDELGMSHVRLAQTINGLPVFGADMTLHADAATGKVRSINGYFAPNRGVAAPEKATAFAPTRRGLLEALGVAGEPSGHAELVYFFDARTATSTLSWKVRVSGVNEGGDPFDEFVFFDAQSLRVVGKDPLFHTAKSRRTYDANNGSNLPGTLLCTDNQSCGDSAAQAAHDGAGDVYDYYSSKFGRDSLDDGGMTLISSVHVLSNWNNAGWTGSQMVYGDGDGVTFSNLTGGYDVIGHELTHGVIENESNLVYAKESGALNEAWADIFGAAAEAARDGNINNGTWLLGEDVYTPGVNGDALRYMDDPTLDGYSRDYYPERLYQGQCQPSSNNDNCGVHGNSGIANLAFVLLTEGGTHPRGKTTEVVSGVGLSTAEQVFYRAQTTYMNSSTNFSGARTATASAAADLFGQSVVDSVNSAWCAVGVGSCGGSGGCNAVGASCNVDGDCCSNKCKGKAGSKTCR